jgi:selenide,water dikinase
MGGSPVMAIAVLGWPLDKLPKETARTVIEGARLVCDQAGIALSGGHSIDISDPVFGLAVTGVVDTNKVKKNNTATEGCELYLTKPIGIGIITTAQKKGFVNAVDLAKAVEIMTTLNKLGTILSELPGVKAMTDVTGFGLLGHLLEICEGSSLAAEIEFGKVPVIPGLEDYMEKKSFPGGTFRNWKSYGDKIAQVNEPQKHLLCDPQTSGGLLVAVDPTGKDEFLTLTAKQGLSLQPFGKMIKKTGEYFIKVY